MPVYTNLSELIGGTPLFELNNIEAAFNLKTRLLAKIEFFNPAGSAKDRAALQMLRAAQASGALQPGGVIIEPTSGNTGIALAALAAAEGYRMILVMPDTMSLERRKLAAAYGAEVVLTPGSEGMTGSIRRAEELAAELPGSFIPGQFDNPENARAHYLTTGPEIWADTEGKLDAFIAGIGTGGTITGTARYLKEQNSDVRIIGLEPEGSPYLTEGRSGPHGLQGIGAGFVPGVLDASLVDEVRTVSDEAAYRFGRLAAAKEGLLVGITSGASIAAAVELSQEPAWAGKTIVVLLPDTGERYLSSAMFSE